LARYRANLKQIKTKLRDLARREGIDLARPRAVGRAVDEALLLGSADILLDGLLELLTPRQRALLDQIAVSRAPMRLDDLAYILADDPAPVATTDLSDLEADVDRLVDLTLLTTSSGIGMHAWTAELLEKRAVSLIPQHERALAMRRRRVDEGIADRLDLLDVPRHLAALGHYDDLAIAAKQATEALPGTLAVAAFLTEISPLVPVTERAWTQVANLELLNNIATGNLVAATRIAETIDQYVHARASVDPDNATWRRDLSVHYERLGDLAIAAGDRPTAKQHFQAGLAIRQHLAATDPENTEWQRDLTVSHNRLGALAIAAGDLPDAEQHLRAGLAIRQRLAATAPDNTEWQRDLSISHNRLGNLAVAAEDLPAAERHFQAGLNIRQRLAATDPDNVQWQRDLSISHHNLGNLAVMAGKLNLAEQHFHADLAIAEWLVVKDPEHLRWQRDLSISHNNRGDLALAARDLTTAQHHYQAGLNIAERLVATDPTNTQWQHDLSISHHKLGDLAVAAGDPPTAQQHFQAGLAIREWLTTTDPTNTEWQHDLSIIQQRLAG
jgi:tetratricopeptide (TPR) repeat protein